MNLRDLSTRTHFSTSTHAILEQFYVPALAAAVRYDRGVGYFSSNWLKLAAAGLAQLAANGGRARIVASPHLDRDDCLALSQGVDARNDPVLRESLERSMDELRIGLATETLSTLAWMIADGLLEFRVALPTGDLDGDFHDKFGVFRDAEDNAVAFHGSPNDSAQAFRNYESISVYYSWLDARESERVTNEQQRFDTIWNNGDANLRVYELPEAVRRNLIAFTDSHPRPYAPPARVVSPSHDKWRHQKVAVAEFLKSRHGILEMATGTGKTRTAINILHELKQRALIDTAIVAAYGTDLLDQWYAELAKEAAFPVYRAYEQHREAQSFLNAPQGALLLTSRQNLAEVLARLPQNVPPRAFLICDEVHGLGSPALVSSLAGRLSPFAYRLGLSATPERVYDAEGTRFIESEIGPVIFRFGLKDAIERGILCEFDYQELEYELSDVDRQAIQQAIKRHHARLRANAPAPAEVLYREIAMVRKVTPQKLAPFRDFVRTDPSILDRCIVFVETAEFGALVQPVLMELRKDFHTYYQDDDRENLKRFARGELDCLITCHRISEGIDIRSVNNIVLFASSRARLETVQRLGRCLRIDPNNESKRARVVDFIEAQPDQDGDVGGEQGADDERRDWFRGLAAIKRLS